MKEEQLYYNYSNDLIPEWMYYYLSDKPIYQKYQEQKDNAYRELADRQTQKRQEEEFTKDVQPQLEAAIEKSLGDLFNDFC